MKLCPDCKKLYSDEENLCPVCQKTLKAADDPETAVVLLSANGFEKERIEAALVDNQIPFSTSYVKTPEKMSISETTAYIYVPISHYSQAVKLCIGIGALSPDCTEAQIAEQTNFAVEQKDENMSAAKRTTVKLISAIAFLALVAIAVFGTDFIMNLIKGLF